MLYPEKDGQGFLACGHTVCGLLYSTSLGLLHLNPVKAWRGQRKFPIKLSPNISPTLSYILATVIFHNPSTAARDAATLWTPRPVQGRIQQDGLGLGWGWGGYMTLWR